MKKLGITKLKSIAVLAIYLVSTPFVYGFDTTGFTVAHRNEFADGSESFIYHYKKWSILAGSVKSAGITSNFDFMLDTKIPFRLGVTCLRGKYFINISTNREYLNPQRDFYNNSGVDKFELSFYGKFDQGQAIPLLPDTDFSSVRFPGDQDQIITKLINSKYFGIEVHRRFPDGSKTIVNDVFELAGSERAIGLVLENCKESGR